MKDTHKENPWKLVGSKAIYDNPWITVTEDRVIRPDGSDGIYGKVHFKNKAIGIIPLDDDMNTWLVGQYRYTLHEYSWEIPMGGVPLGEDTLEGARRELREETGMLAKRWQKLFKIHTSNSVTDEYGYVFLAEELQFGDHDRDVTEVLQVRKLPLKEAVDMVPAGGITDALSIAGLLYVARMMGI